MGDINILDKNALVDETTKFCISYKIYNESIAIEEIKK